MSFGERVRSIVSGRRSDRLGLSDQLSLVTSGRETRTTLLGRNAWLVDARVPARRLEAHPLGPEAWLVSRAEGPVRRARGLGRSGRVQLVHQPDALHDDVRLVQQSLGGFLGSEHVAWLLRELEVTCVLDVGANVGQYAASLRAAGYAGRIVSFEPVPDVLEQLRAASADDPDWHVMPFALGEEDTTTTINVVPGTMSSLLPSSEFGRSWSPVLGEMVPQEIEVRRLDGLLDEALDGLTDPRTYLKMDTQGFDLAAFRGAGERVHELVALQSEVACVPIYDGMPRMREQLAVYEEAGFELSGMFPVTIDPASLRVIELDAVLLRPEALRRG